jgi:hypothetical protein
MAIGGFASVFFDLVATPVFRFRHLQYVCTHPFGVYKVFINQVCGTTNSVQLTDPRSEHPSSHILFL